MKIAQISRRQNFPIYGIVSLLWMLHVKGILYISYICTLLLQNPNLSICVYDISFRTLIIDSVHFSISIDVFLTGVTSNGIGVLVAKLCNYSFTSMSTLKLRVRTLNIAGALEFYLV